MRNRNKLQPMNGAKKNETTSCKTLNETDSILLKEQYVRSHTIWSGPQTHSGSRSPTRFFTKQNNHQTDCVRTQSHTHTLHHPIVQLFCFSSWTEKLSQISRSLDFSLFLLRFQHLCRFLCCVHIIPCRHRRCCCCSLLHRAFSFVIIFLSD